MIINQYTQSIIAENIEKRICARRMLRRLGYIGAICTFGGCATSAYVGIDKMLVTDFSTFPFINVFGFLLNFVLFIKFVFDILRGPYEHYMLLERPTGYSYANEKKLVKQMKGRWSHVMLIDDVMGFSYSAFTFSRKADAAMFKMFFYD